MQLFPLGVNPSSDRRHQSTYAGPLPIMHFPAQFPGCYRLLHCFCMLSLHLPPDISKNLFPSTMALMPLMFRSVLLPRKAFLSVVLSMRIAVRGLIAFHCKSLQEWRDGSRKTPFVLPLSRPGATIAVNLSSDRCFLDPTRQT